MTPQSWRLLHFLSIFFIVFSFLLAFNGNTVVTLVNHYYGRTNILALLSGGCAVTLLFVSLWKLQNNNPVISQ